MNHCPIVKNENSPNTYYGLKGSGNIGKVYRNRSFGGNMSNRKYTKQQVMPHKLQKKNIREGETSIYLNKEKPQRYMPPLIPRFLGSTENPNYRSGYMTDLNYQKTPNNNNYTQYFFPMQELQKINYKIEKNNDIKHANFNYIHTINGLPINKIHNETVNGDYINYPLNDKPYKYINIYKDNKMFENFSNLNHNNNNTNFYESTLSIRDCIEKNNNVD